MIQHRIEDLPVEADPALFEELRDQIVLIKYGGNAMIDEELKRSVTQEIAMLREAGIKPVIVHGGGPVIRELLDMAGVASEFIGGHRKTDAETMRYVEMALRGLVNGSLVGMLNQMDGNAVGLSGKDGNLVSVEKRYHQPASRSAAGHPTVAASERIHPASESGSGDVQLETSGQDLGFVGNVKSVRPGLLFDLLEKNYLPVLAPVGLGPDGKSYNINADMFAGHLAAALKAKAYIVLTDVDGLMEDIDRPQSLVREITLARLRTVMPEIVKGGMIPKVESCIIALAGAEKALIVNGTKKLSIMNALLTTRPVGTKILA